MNISVYTVGPKGMTPLFQVVPAVDGTWIVLCRGFQWGAGPYDKSGCSSQTWPTKAAAIEAIRAHCERVVNAG